MFGKVCKSSIDFVTSEVSFPFFVVVSPTVVGSDYVQPVKNQLLIIAFDIDLAAATNQSGMFRSIRLAT